MLQFRSTFGLAVIGVIVLICPQETQCLRHTISTSEVEEAVTNVQQADGQQVLEAKYPSKGGPGRGRRGRRQGGKKGRGGGRGGRKGGGGGRDSRKSKRRNAGGGKIPELSAVDKAKETNFAFERRVELHPLAVEQLTAGRVKPAAERKDIWIWYEFAPLEGYGRDRDTPSRVVLRDFESAKEYLTAGDGALRNNLVETYTLAFEAMSKHTSHAPFMVFDGAFTMRKYKGIYRNGPIGAFRVRAAATLFAAASYALADYDVHHACIQVLSRFTGDLSYSDEGSGSTYERSGKWRGGGQTLFIPLTNCDLAILKIIGVDSTVCMDTPKSAFEEGAKGEDDEGEYDPEEDEDQSDGPEEDDDGEYEE